MGEVVNLHREKKRLVRRQAAEAAAENRARFGRTPAERIVEAAQDQARDEALDGARLDES